MTVPLSFQCLTCWKFFEWSNQFRNPATGNDVCSKCLARWNAKKFATTARGKRKLAKIEERVKAQKVLRARKQKTTKTS